jgi:leader peptidase (prepilin peptidase)/N-methyltransferase
MRTSLAFVGALAFVVAGIADSASAIALCRYALAGAALAIAAHIDLRERRIPNWLVLPAAAACAALAAAGGASAAAIAAALALVIVLAALALARPEALGMGDVKLALLVAVALDGRATSALLLALALAGIAALTLVVIRGRPALATALPLAPFLCAGALASLIT